MSVVQSGLNSLSNTEILFQDCPNLYGNQAVEGGVFYIN